MTSKRQAGWLLAKLLVLGMAALPASAADGPGQQSLPDAPSARITMGLPGLGLENAIPAPSPADAEQANTAFPAKNRFGRVLRRGIQDQCEIYRAPFHRSAVKWDIAFVVVSGGLIAADKHASGALSRDSVDVSRHISDAGLYSSTATVGGLLVSSFMIKDPDARAHAREAGTLGLEALANTAAVYAVVQVAAGRERPLEGNGKGHFWQNNSLNSSFPSGHSAFTWTTATVIAHEYPRPWVQWLAYGTAGAVSLTRVTGLKHFPTDVVVGGAFGYLIGRHIFHAHCKAGLSAACAGK